MINCVCKAFPVDAELENRGNFTKAPQPPSPQEKIQEVAESKLAEVDTVGKKSFVANLTTPPLFSSTVHNSDTVGSSVLATSNRCAIMPASVISRPKRPIYLSGASKVGEYYTHLKTTRDITAGKITQKTETYKYGLLLGIGSSAKVQEMIVNDSASYAFKFGRKKKGGRGLASINRDYDTSLRICKDGTPWGIKSPPLFKVSVPRSGPNAKGSHREGFMDVKYDSDLYDLLVVPAKVGDVLPIEDCLLLIDQILSGGAALQERRIINPDIKAENIVVMKKDNIQLTHLADFDAALFLDDISKFPNLALFTQGITTHTRQTSIYLELYLCSKFVKENEVGAYIDLENKRMTFSLGCVLYSILTSMCTPYELNKGYNDTRTGYVPLSFYRDDVPDELNYLVEHMVYPDYNIRLNPIDAKEAFNSLLLLKFPDIRTKIEENKQRLGYIA